MNQILVSIHKDISNLQRDVINVGVTGDADVTAEIEPNAHDPLSLYVSKEPLALSKHLLTHFSMIVEKIQSRQLDITLQGWESLR